MRKEILEHLKTHDGITQKEAGINYDIWRLQARIHDLRKKGFEITTEMVANKNGGYHAKYRLVNKNV